MLLPKRGIKKVGRYKCDDSGQWILQDAHGRNLRKISIRTCAICGRLFLSPELAQKHCGHACVARKMQTEKRATTTLADVNIKGCDNQHYSQDKDGQWWYQGSKGVRTRAYVRSCSRCSTRFLASVYHHTSHCSRFCAVHDFYDKHPGLLAGPKSGRWKGGRRLLSNGYVEVWHPDRIWPGSTRKTKRVYVQEHRFVMEKKLGRPLERHERVHHKNGIKNDNRPSNLELWSIGHPSGQRINEKQHCPTCTCFKHK